MKTLNTMRSFAAVMFAATALCACNDNDDNTPATVKDKGLADLEAETIVVGGEKSAVGSAAVAPFSEGVYLVATPEEGIESADDIFATDQYVYVWVAPGLVGQEFDLIDEKSSFTVMAVWGDDIFVSAANDMTSEESGLAEGKCLVKKDGDKYEAFVKMKTVEGVEISMRAAAVLTEEVNSNTISYDEVSKPLRAAFYTIDDGAHLLYFTPSEVDYFGEMQESSIYYVYVMLMNEELATGKTIDLEGNEEVIVGLVDNEHTDEYGDPSMFYAVEGSIKITVNGEGEYEVYLDAKLDNEKNVTVEFAGVCTSADAEKEVSNSFTFNGNTTPIRTVYLDKSAGEQWVVYFSGMSDATFDEAKEYSPVKITLPPFGEDYEEFGFSVYNFMSIEYGPNVWNNANGSVGTVKASLNGTVLKTEFTNYEGFNGEYEGEVNIVDEVAE